MKQLKNIINRMVCKNKYSIDDNGQAKLCYLVYSCDNCSYKTELDISELEKKAKCWDKLKKEADSHFITVGEMIDIEQEVEENE